MKRSIFLVPLLLVLFFSCTNNKIAYVDSITVMEKFILAKNAEQSLISQQDSINKVLDSLSISLRAKYDMYEQTTRKMSKKERSVFDQQLAKERFQIENFQKSSYQVFQERTAAQTQKISDTIIHFIEAYGSANNYDIILSTNANTTSLYAKDSFNITDIVIQDMNSKVQ